MSRILVVFACLLAGLPMVSFAQDTVYRRGGKSVVGVINGMTKLEVSIAVNGKDEKIPSNEISRISVEGEPSAMSDVRKSLAENNYRAALEDMKGIDLKSVERDIAKQEIEYHHAFCTAKLAMTEGGDKEAAEALLKGFAGKYKDSFRFFTVAELAGDLAAASGKWDAAIRTFGALEKVTWNDMRLRAMSEGARALAMQGKFPEALQKFDAVVNDSVKTAETEPFKQLAKVGRANCLANTGKAKEAIEMLAGKDGVIAATDPNNGPLMARAYNALGTAYVKAGQPKEALLAFLHTDLLYFQEADAHAEALHHLSKLWVEAKKNDRATTATTTLKQRYAGSVWDK
jgi:tetratricopeptide (TPR) repeat protein